jgi:hypothetical protein
MTRPLPDLAGVCARHGIVTACDSASGRWVAGYGTDHTQRMHTAPAEADAVVALLKARWEIETHAFTPEYWGAGCSRGLASGGHPSELAAVVALAARLAPSATTGGRAEA